MKIALYIAFQNKSSIDCSKEIINLVSDNNQLKICFEMLCIMQSSYRKNTIFKTLLSTIFAFKFLSKT